MRTHLVLLLGSLGALLTEAASLSCLIVRDTASAQDIKIEAEGPSENEYMCPAALRFVHEYVLTGSALCPPELEGDGEPTTH